MAGLCGLGIRIGIALAGLVLLILIRSIPTVAQGQEYITIFTDDFESGQAKAWTQRGMGTGSWDVVERDGNHYLEFKGNVTLVTGGGPTWSDYTFRVRVSLREGEAGLSFRQTGSPEKGEIRESYVLQLFGADLRLSRSQIKSGALPEYTLLGATPIDLKPDRWYSISVECNGGEIAIAIDGIPKLKYVDTQEPLLSGGIALMGYPGSSIFFDDVWVGRIKAPQPVTAEQSVSSVQPAAGDSPVSSLPGLSFSLEMVATIIAIITGVGSVGGWLVSKRVSKHRQQQLQKLIEQIDEVYLRLKSDTPVCRVELYRMKDLITEKLKEGKLTEESYGVLDKRVDNYLKEVIE